MPAFARKSMTQQESKSAGTMRPVRESLGQSCDGLNLLRLQRAIGNQAVLQLLLAGIEDTGASSVRNPSTSRIHMDNGLVSSIQPKLKTNAPVIQREQARSAPPVYPQYTGNNGSVVVTTYQVENSPFAPNRAIQTACLELEFVPTEGSRFSSPGSINWFQTVRTNSRGGSEPVRPEDEYPRNPPVEFVDGYLNTDPDRQRARFWQSPSFTFRDLPGRENLPDRTTLWQAETSCVGITAQGLERLVTYTWGFTINRRGRGGEIPLTITDSPTAYHMQKFHELPGQGP